MPKTIKPKRKGAGLEARTFKGNSGQTYLIFKTLSGGFHAFVETEAKEAARDCGAPLGPTRRRWESLWK